MKKLVLMTSFALLSVVVLAQGTIETIKLEQILNSNSAVTPDNLIFKAEGYKTYTEFHSAHFKDVVKGKGYIPIISHSGIEAFNGKIHRVFHDTLHLNIPQIWKEKKQFVQKSSEVKYRMDSIVADKYDKQEYVYDDKGNVTQYIYYTWNSMSNKWSELTKRESGYDTNGNAILTTDYKWDNKLNNWVGYYKMEIAYDNFGHRTINCLYYWDTKLNKWVGSPSERQESGFNENGKLVFFATYSWDTNTDKWCILRKYDAAFNKSDQISSEFYSQFNSISKILISKSKTDYSYDKNGNEISSITYNLDLLNNNWIESKKSEDAYNLNDKLVMSSTYAWDAVNNVWKGVQNEEWTYDTIGNELLDINYTWDAVDDVWQEYKKTEWTYDVNGNELLSNYYTWEVANKLWLPNQRSEKSYVVNGKLLQSNYYVWDKVNNVWFFSQREEIAYDAIGRISSYIYFLEPTIITGRTGQKTENVYDANNNVIIETHYEWSEPNQNWYNVHKYEYGYDNVGHQILTADYNWSENDSWIGRYQKLEYAYDVNGDETMNSTYIWTINNDWLKFSKKETVYDYVIPRNMLIIPYRAAHKITQTIQYNRYDYSLPSVYYYSEHNLTDVQQTKNEMDIQLYPSPAIDNLFIEINNPDLILQAINVYDIAGCLTSSTALPYNSSNKTYSFTLNELNMNVNGYYILEVKTNKGVLRKKILVNY